MADYVNLLGADQVQSAGNRMAAAADDMRRAASSIEDTMERQRRFMDDWLDRTRALAEEWLTAFEVVANEARKGPLPRQGLEPDAAFRMRLLDSIGIMNELDAHAVQTVTGVGLDQIGHHYGIERAMMIFNMKDGP